MKVIFRKIFAPILYVFESGEGEVVYKKSHRLILLVIGGLFSFLSIVVFWLSQRAEANYWLPVVVFALIALVCLVVGSLGNDRAVAKIWGTQ